MVAKSIRHFTLCNKPLPPLYPPPSTIALKYGYKNNATLHLYCCESWHESNVNICLLFVNVGHRCILLESTKFAYSL